jgi:hypothetical protein
MVKTKDLKGAIHGMKAQCVKARAKNMGFECEFP